MVEVGTEVCQTPAEARAELVRLRGARHGAGRRRTGWSIAAAGTHPFSLVDRRRRSRRSSATSACKQDMPDLAQQLLIFGTHVHIGIEDRDFLIDAMNVARYFAPARALPVDAARRSGWAATPG